MLAAKDKIQQLRSAMVENQLALRGIESQPVLAAFRKVPRELFFPEDTRKLAYEDGPFPIGEGQTISQPYMVALMTEYLELTGQEKVLEIGTGSGYQTAILAELSREVDTIERIESLSSKAQKILKDFKYKNINFFIGDGTAGLPKKATFDRILATAAAKAIPPQLVDQLAEGGILVIPIGEQGFQVLNVVKKERGRLNVCQKDGCVFVPLVGEYQI